GVNALVNNAGTGASTPFLEVELDEWRQVIDTDLTGAYLAAQEAARRMVDQGDGGRIVNVTSVHEHVPKSGSSAYCAAKGGLGLLTKVIALELAEHGITVNAVAPGEIATPMTQQEDEDVTSEERPAIPLGRPGDAREIGAMIAFLCSPGASYATGASFVVDGGMLLMAAEANARVQSCFSGRLRAARGLHRRRQGQCRDRQRSRGEASADPHLPRRLVQAARGRHRQRRRRALPRRRDRAGVQGCRRRGEGRQVAGRFRAVEED